MKNNQSIRGQIVAGFSLVELLVVIAIISVLASLLFPALANSRMLAKQINETNSAKQSILGWHLYAEDHDGSVLPGYRYGYEAKDLQGKLMKNPINTRYPWRLIPWLGKSFELIYANENRRLLNEFRSTMTDYNYAISLFPSLGVNSRFVGGDDVDLSPTRKAISKFGPFCVLKMSETRQSSDLGVFYSAHHQFGERVVGGFYVVKSPSFIKREWESVLSTTNKPPSYGYVHHRFNGKAVAAFVDGRSETQNFQQTSDMRKWSNIAGSRDWVLTKGRE